MKKLLVATTSKDISILGHDRPGVDVILFGETFALPKEEYEAVYVRDPFVTHLNEKMIQEQLSALLTAFPAEIFLDKITSYDDLLIEDKWRQYQQLAQFMPRTILGGEKSAQTGGKIAKKRISSRSRDILFQWSVGDIDEDWIVQDTITIIEELRVYSVGGKVLPVASVKQSKTEATKAKITAIRQLTGDELAFAQAIVDAAGYYDLVGLDIAATSQGLSLIELNRAPQFVRYNELTGNDLLEAMMKGTIHNDMSRNRVTLGCVEEVAIPSLGLKGITAKVDTGAFSGALHATNIELSEDGKTLSYWPLGDASKKVSTTAFRIRRAKSTHGHADTRYVVPVTLSVRGVEYESHVGITNRETMKFPMLIGRRFLRKYAMLVDVSVNSQYDDEWEKLS